MTQLATGKSLVMHYGGHDAASAYIEEIALSSGEYHKGGQ
jgi:hypothetical protein